MDHDPKTFGGRLAYAMEAKDIRQADLARSRKVSQQAVSEWIRGKNECKQKYAVAQDLGVSPDWLIYGHGNMEAKHSDARAYISSALARLEEADIDAVKAVVEALEKKNKKTDAP